VDAKLVRLVKFTGATPNVRYAEADIRAMARGIVERNPDFILVIPETSYHEFPYGNTCPVELYQLLKDGSLGYQLAAYIEEPLLFPSLHHPSVVEYPIVNPPVQIFGRSKRTGEQTPSAVPRDRLAVPGLRTKS